MKFFRQVRNGLPGILFWSVISAAFIGPGTITTASVAGSRFKLDLLWTLVFATIACVVLQEASARIYIGSGRSLGEAIAGKLSATNKRQTMLKFLVAFAVIFGCAAYEAGNILGAIAGVKLIIPVNVTFLTLILFLVCFALLWIGNIRIIASALGVIVALMGIIFFIIAFQSGYSIDEIAGKSLSPSIPSGSLILVMGLIGTTIVPYNLFLGSGISHGQKINEMRVGLTGAVVIGGLISIAVLIAGTGMDGEPSFEKLAQVFRSGAGKWAAVLLGTGLFAAGFTSAVTAPLASAITAKSVFGADNHRWSNHSRNFRLVWVGVLGFGMIFGVLGIQPIPVIILAQAVNGFLLPFVSVLILVIVNDRSLPGEARNGWFSNILLSLVVWITIVLGLINLRKAVERTLDISISQDSYLMVSALAGLAIVLIVSFRAGIYTNR